MTLNQITALQTNDQNLRFVVEQLNRMILNLNKYTAENDVDITVLLADSFGVDHVVVDGYGDVVTSDGEVVLDGS